MLKCGYTSPEDSIKREGKDIKDGTKKTTKVKEQAREDEHCKERMKRTSSKEAEGENIKKGCIRIIITAVFLKIRSGKKILKITD